MYGTSERYGAAEDEGEVSAWGGIVSARLSTLADQLNTTPEAILNVIEADGISPMVDTAEPKGRGKNQGRGKNRDRPTDPGVRCLALTREDYEALVEAIASEAVRADS